MDNVDWVGDQILCKQTQFSMPEFRSLVHGLVTETRRMLMEDLLLDKQGKDVPKIPCHSLRDNPIDHRSRLAVEGQMYLFDRIRQEEAYRAKFVKPGKNAASIRQGMNVHLAQVGFMEKRLVFLRFKKSMEQEDVAELQ
ncbi:hypothetical protein H2199_001041 [Coniosporium tulheliwenetii]|uniref:Uncharacterized protein n=1 Tax=Coniosporium tulheliwenetii TaxID=3383036 RepID=A0ACC2ZKU3_9PEZI|nr:hypothetical protein H2199_001041 [Cladosporium sp. JES 115]